MQLKLFLLFVFLTIKPTFCSDDSNLISDKLIEKITAISEGRYPIHNSDAKIITEMQIACDKNLGKDLTSKEIKDILIRQLKHPFILLNDGSVKLLTPKETQENNDEYIKNETLISKLLGLLENRIKYYKETKNRIYSFEKEKYNKMIGQIQTCIKFLLKTYDQR